jgi:hypothetical protein
MILNLYTIINFQDQSRYDSPDAKQVAHMQRGPSRQQKRQRRG